MNVVYRKKNFNIYSAGSEFIIHNTKCEFSQSHTHINNFKTAKYLVDLAIHRSIPHHLHHYFLVSLYRLSDNEEYTRKIKALIDAKENKWGNKQNYKNIPKNFRRK